MQKIILILFIGVFYFLTTAYSQSHQIVGIWKLHKYITEEVTQTSFSQEVIVVFCENGSYVSNPHLKKDLSSQKYFEVNDNVLQYFNRSPVEEPTEVPYMKFSINMPNDDELILTMIEAEGRAPKPHQVLKYHYKRLPLDGSSAEILEKCMRVM